MTKFSQAQLLELERALCHNADSIFQRLKGICKETCALQDQVKALVDNKTPPENRPKMPTAFCNRSLAIPKSVIIKLLNKQIEHNERRLALFVPIMERIYKATQTVRVLEETHNAESTEEGEGD